MIKYNNCRLEFESAKDQEKPEISEESLFESIDAMKMNLAEDFRRNAFRESRSLAFAARFVANA